MCIQKSGLQKICLYSTIKSKILKMASNELSDCLEGIMGSAFWVMHFNWTGFT